MRLREIYNVRNRSKKRNVLLDKPSCKMLGPDVETTNNAGLSVMSRDNAGSYTYVLYISVSILFNFLPNQLPIHIS